MSQITLIKVANTYYGLNVKNKPTILGFKEKKHVDKCVSFLATFKQQYGKWPPMETIARIEDSNNEKLKNTDLATIIDTFISIEIEHEDEFADYCLCNALTLMCVTNYEYTIDHNKMSVTFDAYYVNDPKEKDFRPYIN